MTEEPSLPGRRIVFPQHLNEMIQRNDRAHIQRKQDEDGALPAPTECDGSPVDLGGNRPQQCDPHPLSMAHALPRLVRSTGTSICATEIVPFDRRARPPR
jgi:hypothetical protein